MLVRVGVRSRIPLVEVQKNACCMFAAVYESPTTEPASLLPLAALKPPPSDPSHCAPAVDCQRKACGTPVWLGSPAPTTSPEPLMSAPELFVPVSPRLWVPWMRSQTETCSEPFTVLFTTTWPPLVIEISEFAVDPGILTTPNKVWESAKLEHSTASTA